MLPVRLLPDTETDLVSGSFTFVLNASSVGDAVMAGSVMVLSGGLPV